MSPVADGRAPEYPRERIGGLILAGGASRRMGGVAKGLVPLAGRPLAAHVYRRLRPQVGCGWVSVRAGMPPHDLPWPTVEDARPEASGPLAGVAAGLAAARAGGRDLLLVVPCDAPQLPRDLGRRLYRVLLTQQAPAAVVHACGHVQPTFALLRTGLADSAAVSLARTGGALWRWLEQVGAAAAGCDDLVAGLANINTPEQLRTLESALEGVKR